MEKEKGEGKSSFAQKGALVLSHFTLVFQLCSISFGGPRYLVLRCRKYDLKKCINNGLQSSLWGKTGRSHDYDIAYLG